MVLGEKICILRKKAGLSQVDLADKFGVSRQAVSKWETGEAVPEIAKLVALAREFGVSVDYLVSDDDTPSAKELPTPQVTLLSVSGEPVRCLGWHTGVYTAFGGTILAVIGALMRYIDNCIFESFMRTFSSFDMGTVSSGIASNSGKDVSIFFDSGTQAVVGIALKPQGLKALHTENNPVLIIGNVFIWLGLLLLGIGIVLAVMLYRYGHRDKSKKRPHLPHTY